MRELKQFCGKCNSWTRHNVKLEREKYGAVVGTGECQSCYQLKTVILKSHEWIAAKPVGEVGEFTGE